MEFRVLGTVEASHQGAALRFARRQQRLVLGILALEANNVVARDQLIELLWGDRPPARATAVVQTRVSELRAMIDALPNPDPEVQLSASGPGYVLRTPHDRVDAHRFREHLTRWRDCESLAEARDMIRSALGMWRGPILGGGLHPYTHSVLCQGLEAARLTATEDLFDLELRHGNHARIADEVAQLAAAHPSRERLVGQMMMSLTGAGRGTEALRAFDSWRRWLRDDLGTDPSAELMALYVEILRGGGEGAAEISPPPLIREAAGSEGAPTADGAVPDNSSPARFRLAVPRILPPDIADFTGRSEEAAAVVAQLRMAGRGARVAVISGPGGVGKTALALHVAHSMSDDFPDGQLFANLRGVDDDEPTTAYDILGRFLRALGIDGLELPDTLDERGDLYRDLLADRRLIVVLDNAVSEDQLLPLIPGSPACGVIVTSRARLGAALSAHAVPLEVMTPVDALALLGVLAGSARVGVEPDAAAEVASLCGHLPLAIRVAGAKLAAKPHWTVGKLAALLSDERNRLARLTHGHLDVRASIELSYRGLPPEARALLRRLGDLDLSEVGVWLASALLDLPPAETEELLEELLDAQLMEFAGCDGQGLPRYRLHDLVRLFAREKAGTDAGAVELDEARQRAFGATQYLLDQLCGLLWGAGSMAIHAPAPRWKVPAEAVGSSVTDLLGWFELERHVVLSLINRASRAEGLSETVWDLVCSVSPLLPMRRLFDDWQHILAVGLDVTQKSGDSRGEAAVLYRLGMLCIDRRDLDQAEEHLHRSALLFEHLGDKHGKAVVTAYLAMIARFRGRLEAAVERYSSAVVDLTATGDDGGVAFVLRGLGQAHMDLGDVDAADRFFARSLDAYGRSGSAPMGRSQLLFWLGMLRLRQGRHEAAEVLFAQVLEITRTLGDPHGQAQALRGLGIILHEAGRTAEARSALAEALHLVRQPRMSIVEGFIRRTINQLYGELDWLLDAMAEGRAEF